MMKVLLKENIWIEGFMTQTGVDLELLSDSKSFLRDSIFDEFNSNLLYEGKTSEIPEELGKECVETLPEEVCVDEIEDYPIFDDWSNIFVDYSKTHKHGYDNVGIVFYGVKTAKESIQSACNQPYCIIYKTK